MTDEHSMSNLFVGHNSPNDAHRHFMCREHYIDNKNAGGTCPICRVPMGEWLLDHRKIVHTLADGTEVVTNQGMAPAPAAAHAGGKKRNRTGRHYKRARATRRRQSSKKQK
jgi:hypothetical protein